MQLIVKTVYNLAKNAWISRHRVAIYIYRVRHQKPDAQNFNSKETFKKQV